MEKLSLRVCYFGTYRANYSRNQIMIAALRSAEVEVVECHVSLWRGIEDRVEAAGGGWASFGFIQRIILVYWRLLKKYFAQSADYDVMILGYPGQLDVFLARLLTWWHNKPLVMDLFMSIYLIALERGLDQKSAISVILLKWLEGVACRLPDLLICDTIAYRDWHCRTHNLSSDKFRLVPTGADDRIFKPIECDKPNDGIFRVLYYGTFIPNHGVQTIIEAANLLKDHPNIQFELIGKGPEKDSAFHLAERYKLSNTVFVGWVDKQDLPDKIVESDILLGVFGTTPQSMMTVQNKIYEALAMAKPIITGKSPVVETNFRHKSHLYLVERSNSHSLAQGILDLHRNQSLRQQVQQQGYYLFEEQYSIFKLGNLYKKWVKSANHLKT